MMALAHFFMLPGREQRLIVEAVLSLLAVRFAFAVLSFPKALQLLRIVQGEPGRGRVAAAEACRGRSRHRSRRPLCTVPRRLFAAGFRGLVDTAPPWPGRDRTSWPRARGWRWHSQGTCVVSLRRAAGDRRRGGARLCRDRGLYGMSRAYRLSALKLVSDIELPELMPWDGCSDAPVELAFRLGKVPAQLETPDYVASFFQTKGRDRYLAGWPDDARVLVENGTEVTVELAPGTNLTEARAILMSPVQAVLWHQRGLLPLHASVVRVNGGALALAGPSGVGKSTLAATLALRGHDVTADDICIIDAANGIQVLPSTSRLRLWRDALEHFGIAVDGLPRALARSEKYVVEGGEWGETEPHRLVAVVLALSTSVRRAHHRTAARSACHYRASGRCP